MYTTIKVNKKKKNNFSRIIKPHSIIPTISTIRRNHFFWSVHFDYIFRGHNWVNFCNKKQKPYKQEQQTISKEFLSQDTPYFSFNKMQEFTGNSYR